MPDYIMTKDTELWKIVLGGPDIPMNEIKYGKMTRIMPKIRRKYNKTYRKKVKKNYRTKKLLVRGIGTNDYYRTSTCEFAIGTNDYYRTSACEFSKEIQDCLRTTQEGTTQVKELKVDMLTTQYEKFSIRYEGW